MSQQLPLRLPPAAAAGLAGFIDPWPPGILAGLREIALGEASGCVYISGPAGCGKSHLLAALCEEARRAQRSAMHLDLRDFELPPADLPALLAGMNLVALDGLDALDRHADWDFQLFAALNALHDRGASVLLCARLPVVELKLGLADLRSRLALAVQFVMPVLDEERRLQLFLDRAQARGLDLDPPAQRWLITRGPRDLRGMLALLERLDAISLARRRRVTLPLLRDALGGED